MIPPGSAWNLPPTPKQVRAIARFCLYRGIKEPLEEKPKNRWEASCLIQELKESRQAARSINKPGERS